MSHAIVGEGQEALFSPQELPVPTLVPELSEQGVSVNAEARALALQQTIGNLSIYNRTEGLRQYAETGRGKAELRNRYGKDLPAVLTGNAEHRAEAIKYARLFFEQAYGKQEMLDAGYDAADVEADIIGAYASFRKKHIK